MGTLRPKFRETLWFKKGAQDAQARDEAVAAGDLFAPSAVDSLPIEDRYDDDGTVRASDSQMFSVRTGRTEYMPRLGEGQGGEHAIDEHAIIGELKRGRIKVIAAMGGAAVVIAALVLLLV
jgi:hypothetical protein